MSSEEDDAKAARAEQYRSRIHCASWFLKDALFGATVCYMFSALDWTFAASQRTHALSAAVLLLFSFAPPDSNWASGVGSLATVTTLAADARSLLQLSALAGAACGADALPRAAASACALTGSRSAAAAAAVAIATGASLLAALRRLALTSPAGPQWNGLCWYALFWASQVPLVGWPGPGLFACSAFAALATSAAFCVAKYEGRRSWALLPFSVALAAETGAVACAASGNAPAAVAWVGAACGVGGAASACGMMWSFRK